ncbi:VOC family protein [Streptomyces sp. NPDC016469]|uniref:VOC family protein n=1 Tax=Streptomyces sp. NPDC016469 TaxID=3157191 RepID=UPI0033C77DAC
MKRTAPAPGGPCWIGLSTLGVPAAKTSYAAVFGRRCETDPREEAGGYTSARLGESGVAALSPLRQPGRPPAWTVSFAADDADAAVARATAAGGSLPAGPMDVFDQGRFAVVADPADAAFSFRQGRAFAGAGLFHAPGTLGRAELLTRERDRALPFCAEVFGRSVRVLESYPQCGVGARTSAACW